MFGDFGIVNFSFLLRGLDCLLRVFLNFDIIFTLDSNSTGFVFVFSFTIGFFLVSLLIGGFIDKIDLAFFILYSSKLFLNFSLFSELFLEIFFDIFWISVFVWVIRFDLILFFDLLVLVVSHELNIFVILLLLI